MQTQEFISNGNANLPITASRGCVNPETIDLSNMPTENSFQDDESRWSGWLALANKGDNQAYQRLLGELGDTIEAYIRSRFGNIALLEDCVQECLLAVHNARHTYDAARPFRPWMFTIIRHKTIDMLRKSRTYTEVEINTEHPRGSAEFSGRDHLNAMIDGVRILENMAPDHRDAIALTQYAGYTVPEAARQLSISESALKARLRRGLLAIKKQLDDEDLPR